ncbi:MAG: hypothetical protein K0Q55_2052, partial [Verrucomicrobia bacterium]|jgi:predicted DCC family thiol-disulfide oxidoreductase YuxK|nr:hypothetical protein [Verrucomicrobiota bacterium]
VLRVLPVKLRDAVYEMVARNRHRFWAKDEVCALPRPEWRGRVLA